MSVRGKILAALAVPVLVLFVAAAYISSQAIADAREARAAHQLTSVFASQDAFLDAVQAERFATSQVTAAQSPTNAKGEVVASLVDPDQVAAGMAELKKARNLTDTTLANRDRQLRDLSLGQYNNQLTSTITTSLAAKDRLETVRRQFDVAEQTGSSKLTSTYVDNSYENVLGLATNIGTLLSETAADRTLAQIVDAYNSAATLTNQMHTETAGGYLVLSDKFDKNATLDQLVGAGVVANAVQISGLISDDTTRASQLSNTLSALGIHADVPSVSGPYQILRNAIRSSEVSAASAANANQWVELSQNQTAATASMRDDVATAVDAKAADLQSSATTRAAITLGIGVLAFALSVIIALAIARTIVRPLRRLTDAASTVREELPTLVEQVAEPGRGPDLALEEIPVESNDEVGQLARAFNDVNATTITVAKEQAALRGSIAEMFVNVARRDQVLLNRQLSFLDDLERTEEDPSSLSNLFRLDHLATRMRRNAESLLVLAGIDSGRRVRQPMPTSDVIRTASSEIEMYDRVRLILPVDPLMLGHNALSAAHLLAELLENATRFSEPHTPVEVSTNRTSSGVQIIIRDYGLGMGPEELAEARSRVTSSGASEVLGAQRLGLYVVGRLAQRLGATVEFTSSGDNGQGTTAVVSFPTVLFVADSNVPLPEPTDPLAAETQAAVGQLGRGSAPDSLPARTPASSSHPSGPLPLPQPEPEVAVPVDLAALTDGTTATGMPKRRTGTPEGAPDTVGSGLPVRGAAPSAPTSSAANLVLPPLNTPELSADLGAESSGWTPPTQASSSSGGSLPSRRRETPALPEPTPLLAPEPSLSLEPSAAEPHQLPDETSVDLVAVPDDVVRTSMFSGFRSMTQLNQQVETGEPTSATAAVPGVAPVAPADDAPSYESLVAPEEPTVAEPPAVEPAPASSWTPPALVTDVPPAPPAPYSYAPSVPEVDTSAFQQLEDTSTSWEPQFVQGEPALPSRGEQAPAALSEAEAASALWEPAAEGTPSSPYSDLGGYFGRQQAEALAAAEPALDDAAPAYAPDAFAAAAPADATPVADVEPQGDDATMFEQALPAFDDLLTNLPTRRDVREAAKRNRGWFRRGYSQQAYTDALRTLTQPTPVVPASSIHSAEALGLTGVTRTSALPGAEPEPAAFEAYQGPAVASSSEPSAPYAPAEPAPAEPAPAAPAAAYEPTPAYEPAPAYEPVPAPPAAAPPTLAGPELTGRTLRPRSLDPLDPEYVVDPVTAKSEWLASSVLYEEMTTLLRTNSFDPAPTGATYQPVVELTTGPTLTRRARRQQESTGQQSANDRIDRDAEVLRERLRAFQSATRRAREDAVGQPSVDLDAEFEAAFGGPYGRTDGPGTAGDGSRA
ncbi:ATP-binding protein [Luteimicrobium sp. NPDC057192]|uniref:ATP-binding protein n=1 Tax=Luteimicrobium sp. NPDC057192 TaxID=3346042 RepID=UPI00362EBB39